MADRTGLVLATGAAGDFGDRFPPLVTVAGEPMVCHVVDAVSSVTTDVVLACPSEHRRRIASALGDRAARIVSDPGSAADPVTRFGTALDAVDTSMVVLVAGTMPAVDADFLRFLIERLGGNEAVVPRLPDGERVAQQAVYRTGPARAAAAAALVDGGGFDAIVDRLQALDLSPTEVQQITRWRTLRSVTAPADIEALSRSVE